MSLSPRDWATLAHAWWLLLVVDLRLRLSSYERIEKAGVPLRTGRRPAAPEQEAARLHRLVGIASRHHLVRARCLHRSLVLLHLLRRQAIPAEIRLGVRRTPVDLEAHAWVEHNGEPVGEDEPPFSPLEAPDGIR